MEDNGLVVYELDQLICVVCKDGKETHENTQFIVHHKNKYTIHCASHKIHNSLWLNSPIFDQITVLIHLFHKMIYLLYHVEQYANKG